MAAYPTLIDRAISFQLPGNAPFVLPNNPTRLPQKAGTVNVDRPTLDGIVTFVWTKNLQQFVVSGVTFAEGVAPWLAFRAAFLGQRCAYANHLTGESMTVLITDVDVQQDGRNPANWTYAITFKQAARFSTAGPAAPQMLAVANQT